MVRKAVLIFALAFLLIFCSCSKNESDMAEMLDELLIISGESIENNGYVFFSDVEENCVGYLSEDEKKLFYSDRATEAYFSKIEDFAIFMSANSVGEIAVFRCYSASDTDAVVQMCAERADSIKVALRGTEFEEKSKTIRIGVSGRTVLLCLCENTSGVVERFERIA